MGHTWVVPRQLVLVGIVRVVLLGDVVEHQHVGPARRSVREIARHVDRSEVAVPDVLGEGLARLTVERHDASLALQAHEEVVLPALVVMQPANRPPAREGDVRLPDRLRQEARTRDLRQPATLVLEPAQWSRPQPIGCEVRPPQSLDHLVVRVDRLAGVAPVALEDVELERPRADVVVVHVRDLELAAPGWLELGDDIEHVWPVAVEPGDGEQSWRIRRLLDDFGDPAVLDPRNAQVAQVLRLPDVSEEDAGTLSLLAEIPDGLADRAAEDVVREHDDDTVAVAEVPGE